MLSVLSAYISAIPPIEVDGIFGPATEDAVRAAQRWFGLPVTGIVDADTWDEIYDQFSGIETTALRSREIFPQPAVAAMTQTAMRSVPAANFNRSTRRPSGTAEPQYRKTTTFTQFPGTDLQQGMQDSVSQEVVR